ncbi:HIT family protein [Mesorhizobium camelthorni]|uniref:HIT family protein n=1 Tax=Allomesorhizobium camelthorni TaxID=475069 RepID=A0A6G4WHK2_9HYPH|nr:HIT family protein [Mesorhizobium camelthorni]
MSDNNTDALVPCLFCEVARSKIRTNVVFENDRLLAFLDIAPIRRGHVQIVPREHFVHFDDLPPDLASEVIELGQKIARAQKRLYGVERVAFLFTGGDVPHAHAHVVPMVEKTDITSRRYIKEETLTFAALPNPGVEELESVAAELRSAL